MNPKAFFYWLVVALPLSWGLYKAIEKSVPLFSAAAPAVVTPAAATPVPALVVTPTPAAPVVAPAASPAATP